MKKLIFLSISFLLLFSSLDYSYSQRMVLNDGSIYYQNPSNDYEVGVNEIQNNKIPVFESNIPQNSTVTKIEAQTWIRNITMTFMDIPYGTKLIVTKVIIDNKSPYVLYHEMGHAFLKTNNETLANRYARDKGYPSLNGNIGVCD